MVICLSFLKDGFDTCIINIIISLHVLTKIQHDHHLLKFYLSESWENLSNSKLYRICHTWKQILNNEAPFMHCTASWHQHGISRGLESKFILTNKRPAHEPHRPIIILPHTHTHTHIDILG